MDLYSSLLANAFSGASPFMNIATALCSVDGQNVPCGGPLSLLFGGAFMFFTLAFVILIIVAMWKVFTKADQPGWAAIIPIYNIIVMLQIIKKPLWWIVLFFIPFVSVIMGILVAHNLSKAFGKDVGFTIGLVLLPFIFYPILGFGSATYIATQGDIPPVTPTPVV